MTTIYKVARYRKDLVDGWGSEVKAESPEEAVEKYIVNYGDEARYDCDEYEVFVLLPGGLIKRFGALCHVEVSYDVKEIAVDESVSTQVARWFAPPKRGKRKKS